MRLSVGQQVERGAGSAMREYAEKVEYWRKNTHLPFPAPRVPCSRGHLTGQAVNAIVRHITNRTTLVLVSRAQKSTLKEAQRASKELALLGVPNRRLMLNGLFKTLHRVAAAARVDVAVR